MRAIPVIGQYYARLHDWLSGLPSIVLSGGLLLVAGVLTWAALKLGPEGKAALLAWAIIP